MASVREEIVEFLVEQYDVAKGSAEKAVDAAIEDNGDQEDFGVDTDHAAEHIYNTQRYWE